MLNVSRKLPLLSSLFFCLTINKFLSEFGLTLEEVLMADQALKNPEMLQDPSMMGGQPEMAQDNQIQAQLDELM